MNKEEKKLGRKSITSDIAKWQTKIETPLESKNKRRTLISLHSAASIVIDEETVHEKQDAHQFNRVGTMNNG